MANFSPMYLEIPYLLLISGLNLSSSKNGTFLIFVPYTLLVDAKINFSICTSSQDLIKLLIASILS